MGNIESHFFFLFEKHFGYSEVCEKLFKGYLRAKDIHKDLYLYINM